MLSIKAATISANSNQENNDGVQEQPFSEEVRANLMEKMREFDAKLQLDREKLNLDREKAKNDSEIKRAALRKKSITNSK